MLIYNVGLNFKTLQGRKETKYFIVHHAQWINGSVWDIHTDHLKKGWSGFAYNFFIEKNGRVIEGRPIWSSDADARGYNYNSLSVCLQGDFLQEQPTKEQEESLIKLFKECKVLYKEIVPLKHSDVNKTTCPNIKNWYEIKEKMLKDDKTVLKDLLQELKIIIKEVEKNEY